MLFCVICKYSQAIKRQAHKMVKHTQTIRQQIGDKLATSVFDHFVGLVLKVLKIFANDCLHSSSIKSFFIKVS